MAAKSRSTTHLCSKQSLQVLINWWISKVGNQQTNQMVRLPKSTLKSSLSLSVLLPDSLSPSLSESESTIVIEHIGGGLALGMSKAPPRIGHMDHSLTPCILTDSKGFIPCAIFQLEATSNPTSLGTGTMHKKNKMCHFIQHRNTMYQS